MGFRNRFPFLSGALWVLVVSTLLVAIQLLSNALLGVYITGLIGEIAVLAIFAIAITFLVWLILRSAEWLIAKWRRESSSDPNFEITNPKYLEIEFVLGIVFVFMLVPHLWMSHKLKPIKQEFDRVEMCRECLPFVDWKKVKSRLPATFIDHNTIIELRSKILAKYGYIPLGTGQWWCEGGFHTKIMAYVWVPLPSAWSRGIAYSLLDIPEEERQKFEEELAKLPY